MHFFEQITILIHGLEQELTTMPTPTAQKHRGEAANY
jgi:hypothetical protein